MKAGVLLCGHGSRKPGGVKAFKNLIALLRRRYQKKYLVDYGFLEFNHPTYEAAVERLYHQGVRKIYALPVILFAGSHAKNDIPFELNTIQTYYKDLNIVMSRPIGVSSFLIDLSYKRLKEAQANFPAIDKKEICLLVIGRGTTDPDANSDVGKLTHLLWESMGVGFATTGYSGTAYPSIAESISLIEKLPFKRVLVMPFLFFTGVLLQRIRAVVTAQNEQSDKQYLLAAPFGTDELILKAFDERLEDAITGNVAMNCQLCKYRKQVIGFEQEFGKEQIGHHLNVKGILFEEDEKPKETKFSFLRKIADFLGV